MRWGAKRRITGTLQSNGQPVVGAKLDVVSQPKLMGAKPVTLGQVSTDSRGRFVYLIPKGASRAITIGYRWYTEAASHTHTTTVNVDVIPRVAMKTSKSALRNKQSVRFSGKVKGAPRGVRKVVEIQGLDGRKWRTIATVRLGKKGGKYRYSYRFTRTTRPTLYKFRASVRAEKGWPFLTGHSRSRTVTVRP